MVELPIPHGWDNVDVGEALVAGGELKLGVQDVEDGADVVLPLLGTLAKTHEGRDKLDAETVVARVGGDADFACNGPFTGVDGGTGGTGDMVGDLSTGELVADLIDKASHGLVVALPATDDKAELNAEADVRRLDGTGSLLMVGLAPVVMVGPDPGWRRVGPVVADTVVARLRRDEGDVRHCGGDASEAWGALWIGVVDRDMSWYSKSFSPTDNDSDDGDGNGQPIGRRWFRRRGYERDIEDRPEDDLSLYTRK